MTYRLRSDLGFHQDSIYGVWTLLFLGTTPKRIAFAGRIVRHSQPVGLHTQIVVLVDAVDTLQCIRHFLFNTQQSTDSDVACPTAPYYEHSFAPTARKVCLTHTASFFFIDKSDICDMSFTGSVCRSIIKGLNAM